MTGLIKTIFKNTLGHLVKGVFFDCKGSGRVSLLYKSVYGTCYTCQYCQKLRENAKQDAQSYNDRQVAFDYLLSSEIVRNHSRRPRIDSQRSLYKGREHIVLKMSRDFEQEQTIIAVKNEQNEEKYEMTAL